MGEIELDHAVASAARRRHQPAEASLRGRGAGLAAYMQAYADEDGLAKQVQSLHHNLKTTTDLELLKGVCSDAQSVAKCYSDGPLQLLMKSSLYVKSDGHDL